MRLNFTSFNPGCMLKRGKVDSLCGGGGGGVYFCAPLSLYHITPYQRLSISILVGEVERENIRFFPPLFPNNSLALFHFSLLSNCFSIVFLVLLSITFPFVLQGLQFNSDLFLSMKRFQNYRNMQKEQVSVPPKALNT